MEPHHRFGKVDRQALRDAVEERLWDRTLETLFIRVSYGIHQDAAADAFFDELSQRHGYWKTVHHSGGELFTRWCGLRLAEAAAEKSRRGHGLPAATQVEIGESRYAAADDVDALENQLLMAGMDRVCDATTIHVSKTPVDDPTSRTGCDEEGQSL